MRIKKTSQYIEGGASLSNVYGTSDSNGYTQEYINSLCVSSDWTSIGQNGFNVYWKKVGNVVCVTGISQSNISIAGATLISLGNISDGSRPSMNVRSGMYSRNASDIWVQVQTNGNVVIFNWGSAKTYTDAGQVAFTITYVI